MAERTDERQAVDFELADLITSLPLLPWEMDADGAMIWLGPQWEEYAGEARDSLLGHAWRGLLHPDDAPGVETAWLAGAPARLPFETECRLRGADGSFRWFLARAAPIRDAGTGAVQRWAGTCTDVEPLKRLAAQADAQAVLASQEAAAAHAEAYERERAARAEAERSARRAQVVAEVAHALSLPVTLDAVLEAATETLATSFSDGGSGIWLYDEEARLLRLATAYGYSASGRRLMAEMSPDAATVTAQAFRTRDVVVFAMDDPAMPGQTQHLIRTSEAVASGVAATPLVVGGQVIGAMSLFSRGQSLDESWAEALRAVGTQVVAAVERTRLLDHERGIASRLQGALLPALQDEILLATTGLAVAHRYRPAGGMTVGGDFYDVWSLADADADGPQRLAVVLGDISGKGLEAAVQTSAIRHAVLAYAHEDPAPAAVISRVNALAVALDLLPGGFATMFFATVDAATGVLEYCSAGHESLLLRSPDGVVRPLAASAPALGLALYDSTLPASAVLEPGGEMVLFTDGITEARAPGTRALLGLDGLEALLAEVHAALPPDAGPTVVASHLLARVEAYAGGHLEDDAALLVIARPEASSLATAVASASRL